MKASTAVVVAQSTGFGRPIAHSARPVATPRAMLTRLIVLMNRPMSRCAWRTPARISARARGRRTTATVRITSQRSEASRK